MHSEFVDTIDALKAFLESIGPCKGEPPSFYVDLEGNNLSRLGTLSIVTILVVPQGTVYMIDVTTLKNDAFSTAGSDGSTLKSILESAEVTKVFSDIRNDADALFNLHGVRVNGIEDLQLMELATRSFTKKHVNGLAKCIERDSTLEYSEYIAWKEAKIAGRDLFDPAHGGSYNVFDQRPLSSEMTAYCVQDVVHMPNLRKVYRAKLCNGSWRKVVAETQARIQLSQSPEYNGKGPHMAEGPLNWESGEFWLPTTREEQLRTLLETQTPAVTTSSPRKERDFASDILDDTLW